MWFNIAASLGNEYASKNRDIVAGLMTPADISKVQQLARECVANDYMGCWCFLGSPSIDPPFHVISWYGWGCRWKGHYSSLHQLFNSSGSSSNWHPLYEVIIRRPSGVKKRRFTLVYAGIARIGWTGLNNLRVIEWTKKLKSEIQRLSGTWCVLKKPLILVRGKEPEFGSSGSQWKTKKKGH